jgi:DNA-binding transcriptional ArsR family regulator
MDPRAVFAALADPTRLEVLDRIARSGPATATEISATMPISRQAVSKHLAALDAAGLITREQSGREVRYSFEPGPLDDVVRWAGEVGDNWDRRLKRLSQSLDPS